MSERRLMPLRSALQQAASSDVIDGSGDAINGFLISASLILYDLASPRGVK
jgi:hypothetical protein